MNIIDVECLLTIMTFCWRLNQKGIHHQLATQEQDHKVGAEVIC
jgi:hypothetical protein